ASTRRCRRNFSRLDQAAVWIGVLRERKMKQGPVWGGWSGAAPQKSSQGGLHAQLKQPAEWTRGCCPTRWRADELGEWERDGAGLHRLVAAGVDAGPRRCGCFPVRWLGRYVSETIRPL